VAHAKDAFLSNSRIVQAYRAKTPASAALAQEAKELFPSGIVHDARYIEPYGIYVTRAEGSRKWDKDGNEYVDYIGGHGALLLGHNHPEVVTAIQEALPHGTHPGANHEREIRWAQIVRELIPCAERVRFTSSGTEATHMALRLARAQTGKHKVARFKGHFHGWHDHMTSGYTSHFDGAPTAGVLPALAAEVVLLPPGDRAATAAAFEADDDIAAVILEPTGGSFGMVPHDSTFLTFLRELTEKHGVILIFDEVITGFRVSPGGAQAHFGVRPDMSTHAKIIGGGLPGGAVVGRKDILDNLDFAVAKAAGREKIQHPGTFNANPVSAAAGTAALTIVRDTDACARASAFGEELRAGLNAVLEDESVPWAVYGTFSVFHLFMNPRNRAITPSTFDPLEIDYTELKERPDAVVTKIRLAMLINGVDMFAWPGGMSSAANTAADLPVTIDAFRETIRMLKREGEL
jgi:glutamate-1-semialdehyde 2,1-aminomutase